MSWKRLPQYEPYAILLPLTIYPISILLILRFLDAILAERIDYRPLFVVSLLMPVAALLVSPYFLRNRLNFSAFQ